ncbi:hypothetical protein JCM8097_007259 [Rhodosporidiobolus ruineniae]
MVSVAELRKKAKSAASSASLRLPSKPTKYEPVRPGYGTPTAYPTQQERQKNSTALQVEAAKHVPPPPPRRFASTDSATSSTASAGPSVARNGGPPPTPARKPAALAPPSLPVRRDTSPAPPYAPQLPSRTPSYASTPPVSPPLADPPRAFSPAAAPAPPVRRLPPASPPVDLAEQLDSRLGLRETEAKGWKPFSQYDQQDRQDMFAALDSFFNNKFGAQEGAPPPLQAASPAPYLPPSPSAAPPPVALSTRPRLPASSSSHVSTSPSPYAPTPKPPELHAPSYPPTESHSSSALSLLHHLLFHPLSSPWFLHGQSAPPLPPVLAGRSDVRFTCSWSQRGPDKSHTAVVLFGDTSVAWYRFSWSSASETAGRAHLDVAREGRYRPRCPPLDGQTLYDASETYGPLVVQWAEAARAAGVPVARGECWDLANEALLSITNEHAGQVPAPFPSIGRTHGALLYHAHAGQRDEQGRVSGTWTGGDVYVRPGDVVEWRKVTIREVGMQRGAYSKLGDPDHTALILSAAPPLSPPSPADDTLTDPSYPLSSLVSLTVLEQSLGHAPKVATYDLAALSEGEVWIYRPCGMRTLCGMEELSAAWPEESGVESWQVGELE